MKDTPNKRIVAIVGRPNVGKSSIFNRLCKKRISIVHEEEGVTRDRVAQDIQWQDKSLTLIDTAGLLPAARSTSAEKSEGSDISAGIRQQIQMALADASVIMLATDVEAGLTDLDQEIAEILRKSDKKIVLAANKADNSARDEWSLAFSGLGFPVFPVSALHARGFNELMPALLKALPPAYNPTISNPTKVAITGRANVGKSSLINRLLQNDRVIVASTPGTTRDSIDIPFSVGAGETARHYVLVDTAGIRRKRKTSTEIDRFAIMRAEHSIKLADVVVLVIDAVTGPSTQDKKIAKLILQHKKGCVLAANKWDLINGITEIDYLNLLRKNLPFMDFIPMLITSAKTGFNIHKIIDATDLIALHVTAQIPTTILNQAINTLQIKKRNTVKGKRLKIYYAVQVHTNPIKIVLFVNQPAAVNNTYLRYLAKGIRQTLGMDGAPLFFEPRPRRKVPAH